MKIISTNDNMRDMALDAEFNRTHFQNNFFLLKYRYNFKNVFPVILIAVQFF